ncbi:hypothetical protein PR202_ga14309 [Eleusine coracana subsp. coracana]|uniref:Uncharacterized protein n=1 Tax=Eleusine coracana subsp. coracana TaxID=191504 RepID=A0AAV5CH72_ELECO|nr:hypothetical protein PR202_ga14309 [Eleusine coracana subsp. coracana]
MLVRFWAAFGNTSSSILKQNATSSETVAPAMPKGAERLPPNIVVSESDLHLRRLWGDPRQKNNKKKACIQDTPPRKYLLALTVGYSEKANVNATVEKFSDKFDVVLFHYDGRTTEWDEEFEWSKKALHISARKQAKWWYAKRFLHPSIVAAYDYIFLWDEDLGVDKFDAEEYVKLIRKHGLEISQPGLDGTRGKKSAYAITMRSTSNGAGGGEVHKTTSSGGARWNCTGDDVHKRPCSGFVEVMAPVFSKKAWPCVWHLAQNDLIHGWGLDWNFWRCVDEPEEQIGVVDAQYVVHRGVPSLGRQGNADLGEGGKVRARAWREFADFKARIIRADRAQEAQQRTA